jgi:hypothetical protein
MELEWIRNVDADGDSQLLFWAYEGDFQAFDAAIRDDPTVALEASIDVGERQLYRVTLEERGEATDLYSILVDTGSVAQRSTVTKEGWQCHFGFADRAALDRFFDACREYDIEFEIHQLYGAEDPHETSVDLTETQKDTLVAAVESGYFEVPRQCNLTSLGEQLGVSDTAVSTRLRRALKTLIQQTVSTGREGTVDVECSND